MDLTPTPEQQAFRAELRAWLEANLPWGYGTGMPPQFDDLAEEVAFLRTWQGQLAAARWVGVAWPAEYGGPGGGAPQPLILREGLGPGRAPPRGGRVGGNIPRPPPPPPAPPGRQGRWRSERPLRCGHLFQ